MLLLFIVLLIFIIFCVLFHNVSDGNIEFKNKKLNDFYENHLDTPLYDISIVGCVISFVVFVVLFIVWLSVSIVNNNEHYYEKKINEYETLLLKKEHIIYGDDFSLAEKETIEEINEWNNAILTGKLCLDNPFLKAYTYNYYAYLEPIDLPSVVVESGD